MDQLVLQVLPSPPAILMPGMVVRRCRYAFEAGWRLSSATFLAPAGVVLAVPDQIMASVPKRQAEYLAGRFCAADALRELGAATLVSSAPDRSPRWPAGVVGSISHAVDEAMAVVASQRDLFSVGIDIEQMIDPVMLEQIAPTVLAAEEWTCRPALWSPERFVTLAFCVKEALYKAHYPVQGRFFEFLDAQLIAIDADVATLALRPDFRLPNVPDDRYRVHFVFEGTRCMARLALAHTPVGHQAITV
jgi:enterobactin synthetase component D